MLHLARTLERFRELVRERGGDPRRPDPPRTWDAFLAFIEEEVGSGPGLEPLGADLVSVELLPSERDVMINFVRDMHPFRDEDAFSEPLSVGAGFWFDRPDGFGDGRILVWARGGPPGDLAGPLYRSEPPIERVVPGRLRAAMDAYPDFNRLLAGGYRKGLIEVADPNEELIQS